MIKIKNIKEKDKLYLVYVDLNHNYQIGEATVTGLSELKYPVGDRWETWKEKQMTNILYEFNGIKFSRNLDYILENTHFVDYPDVVNNKLHVANIMSGTYVDVFTTRDEAKDYVLDKLIRCIDDAYEKIRKANDKIKFYKNNCDIIYKN